MFASIAPTGAERTAVMPGDFVVTAPDVVLDRGMDLPAPPEVLWPWITQLGKGRGGWYWPAAVERWIPAPRRGLRAINSRHQSLAVGARVPGWGGPTAAFEVALIDPGRALVYRSRRGRMTLSWAIVLTQTGSTASRLHLRLRVGGVRRKRLAGSAAELVEKLTVAGLAAGLRERVSPG